MNARFVLQAILEAHLDLGGQSVAPRVHRRADDSGETRIDQGLPADDNEDARSLRVAAALSADTVEIASPQASA
jgi:hypothetical protein